MALTVETLKAFMHPSLLEQFADGDDNTDNKTLISAVEVSNQSYNILTSSLPSDVIVRFDSVSFQVKNALIYVYNYVMQDYALLHSLTMSGMGISEDQVFQHFLALRNAEQNEVNSMRDELLEEIKDSKKDTKNLGVMLKHAYGSALNGRRL